MNLANIFGMTRRERSDTWSEPCRRQRISMGKEQARLFQAYTKSLRQSTGSGRAHQVFVGSEQAAQ